MPSSMKKWVRGHTLGSGSFGTVNVAIPTNASTQLPSPTAVKSSVTRDLKSLQEMVASITDWKTLEKMSCKPFTPKFLDLLIAQEAPQLYSDKEFVEITNLRNLITRFESRFETKNTTMVTRKRQIEEIPEEERVVPVKKKSRKIIKTEYELSPDLPLEFKNRITELNDYDIKFLMQKQLFFSDVKYNNNRLSMPIDEIMCDFLTEAEIDLLDERESTKEKEKGRLLGVEVAVLDPCLREFTVQLKKWSMQRTYTYNLVKNWNDSVPANKFEKDQELRIWSFRVHNKLYIILNKL